MPLLHKTIKFIQKTPSAYWVSTGDLLNVALKTSLSDSYKSDPLGKEFEALKKELGPISEKCLGLVSSNHHARFERTAGMSLDKLIADTLNIPFLGHSGVINITLGGASYIIGMHHGHGGGRKRGAKTSNAEEFGFLFPGADIYLTGHTHAFSFFINEQPYVDRKRNNLVTYPAYFCVAGHFLNWKNSYAEEKQFKPMPMGAAVLKLHYRKVGRFRQKKVVGDLFG